MDKVIVDYYVVSTGTAKSLAMAVKEKIDDGWQPYGELIVTPGITFYTQPVVKYSY